MRFHFSYTNRVAPIYAGAMVLTLIGTLLLLQSAPTPTKVELWDRVYSDGTIRFPTTPNVFLTEVVKGLKPGRALDVAMGQGRNSVYLAKLGWDVCGFDISERAMELARKSATSSGVKITTINSTLEDFDYGSAKWDLVVGTYVGVAWLGSAVKGLKPGGFLVVEGYTRHPNTPPGAGWGPNELVKLFLDQNLEILRYEDVKSDPEWLKSVDGVVRVFARKPA